MIILADAACDRDAQRPRSVVPVSERISDPTDLASLVREWLVLSTVIMLPRLGVAGGPHGGRPSRRLYRFVGDRLAERAALACEAEDGLAQRFALWELQWVEHGWAHAGSRSRRDVEMESYLRRVAQRYRRHPEFDIAWL